MSFVPAKARLVLASGIVAAFFLPAYNNVSGFRFAGAALAEAKEQTEWNQMDGLLLVTPVLLLPVAAAFVALQTFRLKYTAMVVLALPLLLLIVFAAVVYMSDAGTTGAFRNPATLLRMQPGFYLAFACSVLLPFTKNAPRKRRRRQTSTSILTANHTAKSKVL